MTRDRSAATRRGFLALAGSATLAGCGGFGSDFFEDDPPEIDGDDLRDAISGDVPTVSERFPVRIEQSHLDATAARARDDLESVPAPFDADEIPNGAIRAELTSMHEQANEHLERAERAETGVESAAEIRGARESARAVAAGWKTIDSGLTSGDVREIASEVRNGVETFRGRWRYVGDDSIRAVVAHARIEELVASAVRQVQSGVRRSDNEPENPVTIGEFAGQVEHARAALDDAGYLFDRYESSLDETRDVRNGLETAVKSLSGLLDDRREAVPHDHSGGASSLVDRDIEDTPVASALSDLLHPIDYAHGVEGERETGQYASAVRSVHETLVRIRAFESLRERAEDGDYVTVESAGDVRDLRNGAIQSVEAAVESGSNPNLGRHILADAAAGIEYADDRLERHDTDDDISVEWLTRELGQYVLVDSIARATPPTTAEVGDLIRTTV
ncbi:hypothetical protein [Halorussus amylolyticus]|uniref:hypothetical protein n=1 Tax=Halorussus amylolyticus TaxID=1126242 RepID=UPI00104F379B|nr:hypothetical protein [Halorussus amylolyticus]